MKTRLFATALSIRSFIGILVLAGLGIAEVPPASAGAVSEAVKNLYQEGVSSYDQKDYNAALKYFKAALELDADHIASIYAIGVCHYKLGDPEKALKCLEDYLAHSPSNEKANALVVKIQKEMVQGDQGPRIREKAAQGPLGHIRQAGTDQVRTGRLYLTAFFPVSFHEGDLDGDTLLMSTETGEYVAVPSVSGGVGYGFGIGVRGSRGFLKRLALEGSYQQTLRTVQWKEASGEADAYLGEVTAKVYINPEDVLQGYGLGGYSLGGLMVRGGSLYQGEVRDTRYDMGGIHAGLGGSLFVHPRFFFDIQLLYRFMSVKQVIAADNIAQDCVKTLQCGGLGFKMSVNLNAI